MADFCYALGALVEKARRRSPAALSAAFACAIYAAAIVAIVWLLR